MTIQFKSGDYVTRITPYLKERGIVKRIADDKSTFVVYHCGGDWKHYNDYTAARTYNNELVRGWK